MKTILNGRHKGKTTKAVRRAIKTGAYLVVRSHARAVELSEAHPKLRFPITYSDLLSNKLAGSYVRNIVIDDADDLLRHMLPGIAIEAITITREPAK